MNVIYTCLSLLITFNSRAYSNDQAQQFRSNCVDETYHSAYEELVVLVDQRNYLHGLRLSDSLLVVAKRKGWNRCEIFYWVQYERGEALETNNDFIEAINLYNSLLVETDGTSFYDLQANLYLSKARILEYLGRREEAYEALQSAHSLAVTHQLNATMARYHMRFSSYHRIYGDQDTALHHASEAVRKGKIYNTVRAVYDGHLLLSVLTDNTDTLVYHNYQVIKISNELKLYPNMSNAHLRIATHYSNKNLWDAMKNELDLTGKDLDKITDKNYAYFHYRSRQFELMSHYYQNKGKLDSALHYARLAHIKNKNAESRIRQDAITSAETSFKYRDELEQAETLTRHNFIQRLLLISGTIVIILLCIIVYYHKVTKNQIKVKNKTIEKMNSDLSQALENQSFLLSEVHHRVKNNLQTIIGILNLEIGNELTSREEVIEQLSEKIYSISLIHEQLYQEGNFGTISMNLYLSDILNHFKKVIKPSKELKYIISANDTRFNLETTLPIGLICTELISNSVKHFPSDQEEIIIKIHLTKKEDRYHMVYQDNGCGYNPNSVHVSSTGTKIIDSMVRQLNGKARQHNDSGAVFELTFREKILSKI